MIAAAAGIVNSAISNVTAVETSAGGPREYDGRSRGAIVPIAGTCASTSSHASSSFPSSLRGHTRAHARIVLARTHALPGSDDWTRRVCSQASSAATNLRSDRSWLLGARAGDDDQQTQPELNSLLATRWASYACARAVGKAASPSTSSRRPRVVPALRAKPVTVTLSPVERPFVRSPPALGYFAGSPAGWPIEARSGG